MQNVNEFISAYVKSRALIILCSICQDSWYPHPGMTVKSVRKVHEIENESLPRVIHKLSMLLPGIDTYNKRFSFDLGVNLNPINQLIETDSSYLVTSIQTKKTFDKFLMRYVTKGTITLICHQNGEHLQHSWQEIDRVGMIGFKGILEEM